MKRILLLSLLGALALPVRAQQNIGYRAELDRIGFRYENLESTRGHLWCNWRQYLVQFAPRLFR